MMSTQLRSQFVRFLAFSIALPLFCHSAVAQDPAPPNHSASVAETKVRTAPRGRLPTYFSRVVDTTQREKIYEIQGGYSAQIAALQKQIDELVKKRDTEVDAVLSPEQMANVSKLRDEAKSRRAGKSSSAAISSSGNSTSSGSGSNEKAGK